MNKTAPSALDPLHQKLSALMRVMDVDQWKHMIARIDQPTIARIIVEHLDSDAALKASYAGIYIRARDTVERYRMRQAKALKRAQLFVRLGGWISRLGKQPKPEPLVWPKLNPL
jgi:hypothetical protein